MPKGISIGMTRPLYCVAGHYRTSKTLYKTGACKTCNRESSSARYANDKAAYSGRVKNARLKRSYGITLYQYEQLFQQQNGQCAVCRKSNAVLCIDHDHKTGKVRGLLCFDCNTSIGKLGDTIEALMSAVRYLEEYRA